MVDQSLTTVVTDRRHLGLQFGDQDSPKHLQRSCPKCNGYLTIQFGRGGRHSSTTIRAISSPNHSASSLMLTVNR
jgi:hypothetical protein